MCGFIEVDGALFNKKTLPVTSSVIRHFLPNVYKAFYPAFGKDPTKTIDIIVEEDGLLKQVSATWWFDCRVQDNVLTVGARTTFNARNLSSPYWQHSLQRKRGVLLATGLGESKKIGKTKHQYYMSSDSVFLLGVLYQKHSNGQYSCAVITRDAHPKMSPYHDKAFPCFLPIDDEFLNIWLSSDISQHESISDILNHPKLYPTLNVQRVKTYKGKEAYRSFAPVSLLSDLSPENSLDVTGL
jgi:putative SOS response-associated peptidase YedK